MSKKREATLLAAKDLFWRYGFRKVTVEEICEQEKVSKMTFYKMFPNKLDLAKHVFAEESDKGVVKFKET